VDLADLVSPVAMRRAVRGWLVVLGAVVACRRATPPAETTTTADPPAATGPVRPAGCDAPREGESLAEFDARCRAGAQAAGSDCDVPKEDESFDAFQQRCARRARVRGAARPTMPTAPVVPGVSDAGATEAAVIDVRPREFTAMFRFGQSLTLRAADVAALDRARSALQDDISACATRSAARGEDVPGVLRVQFTVAGRHFTSTSTRGPTPPSMPSCLASAFRSIELPSDANGEGSLVVMLQEK
jgi:hypothetical protein